MFAKLINETTIEKAPRSIRVDATTYETPNAEQYAACGYYELVETEPPEPRKWYSVVAKYATVENKIQQSWDYVKQPKPDYSELIVGYIREVYSINDELAIQRQWDNGRDKKQEFIEYNNFCDDCKLKAKADIAEWEEA